MRIHIQDIPVDLLVKQELTELIGGWFKTPGQPRQIVTLNALMLVNAGRDPQLQRALQAADLVLIDGFGIEMALRRRGYRAITRWAGIDLLRAMLSWCAGSGFPVFCYGGPPAITAPLRRVLREAWPQLKIAGIQHGFPPTHPEGAMAMTELRRRGPCLLVAGLGSPAQELFLAQHLPQLPGTVGIGVGGALEVLAGLKREAPPIVRRCGWEWLYRMAREPARWKKLPDLIRFWTQHIRFSKEGGDPKS